MNLLTCESNVFLLKGEPFFPCICRDFRDFDSFSGYNASIVSLNAGISSNLKWDAELRIAENLIAKGSTIFWHLNLDLESLTFPLANQLALRSLEIAAGEFLRKCLSPFRGHTLGVILYYGKADLIHYYKWDEASKETFQDWLLDRKIDDSLENLYKDSFGKHLIRVFCITLISEYLHRIAASFPEDLLSFAFFDATGISNPAYQAHLFLKERFSHLNLGIRGACLPLFGINWEAGRAYGGYLGRLPIPEPISPQKQIGFCFPEDLQCSREILMKIERLFHIFAEKGLNPRIIPEAYLTEEWQELEDLIVLESSFNQNSLRKLQGFCAAGGRVITEKEKLDLPNELLFDQYISQS